MAYQDYTVKLNFNDGTYDYDLPLVQSISDPKEGIKATVIEGTRADGSIVIPGGKKSQNIAVEGIVFDADGYEDVTTTLNTLKASVTTDQATLTLKHWNGAAYITDWAYTVRRIEPITITDNSEMRTGKVNYSISFLVLAY